MDMIEAYEIYRANKADKDMRNAFKRSISFVEVCVLIEKVKTFESHIDKLGEQFDECTFNIIGKKCSHCGCFRNT